MTPNDIRKLVSTLPGVTEEVLWGDNLVFKVGGKMFVVSGMEPGSSFSIKAADKDLLALTEIPGIEPAPYLARAGWVRITPKLCQLRKPLLKDLIRQSYDLILHKLPKRTQRELDPQGKRGRKA